MGLVASEIEVPEAIAVGLALVRIVCRITRIIVYSLCLGVFQLVGKFGVKHERRAKRRYECARNMFQNIVFSAEKVPRIVPRLRLPS